MPPVVDSASITTLEEARTYYRAKLVGAHKLSCHGRQVSVVFDYDVTHTYSESPRDGILLEGAKQVTQPIKGGKFEVRLFSLARARWMDHIIPALTHHTLCSLDVGRPGQQRNKLHGPCLPTGDYLRVILRPGPKTAWTCMTAFPVTQHEWETAAKDRQALFPPA
jgi:hypothetical protein